MNSESGFSPKDAEGSETAPGEEAPAASAFRHHLSTQKMYELKTKLRCSRERGSLGRAGAQASAQGLGTSDPRWPFLQMW